jgi:cytochrome c556
MRAQVVALGKTCKGCHDSYRSPDYEKDAEQ